MCYQNWEGCVGDIYYCLIVCIICAVIEVGGVMEYMEFVDRFVVCIYVLQFVDNVLNLVVINIVCCQ